MLLLLISLLLLPLLLVIDIEVDTVTFRTFVLPTKHKLYEAKKQKHAGGGEKPHQVDAGLPKGYKGHKRITLPQSTRHALKDTVAVAKTSDS